MDDNTKRCYHIFLPCIKSSTHAIVKRSGADTAQGSAVGYKVDEIYLTLLRHIVSLHLRPTNTSGNSTQRLTHPEPHLSPKPQRTILHQHPRSHAHCIGLPTPEWQQPQSELPSCSPHLSSSQRRKGIKHPFLILLRKKSEGWGGGKKEKYSGNESCNTILCVPSVSLSGDKRARQRLPGSFLACMWCEEQRGEGEGSD